MSRRTMLACCMLSAFPADTAARAAPPDHRVAALDWSVVEVALAIGVTPVAASEAAGYRQWVSEPVLPIKVPDLGLRIQPNLELLQMLDPTLILSIPERADVAAAMARIAPTVSLPIYSNTFSPYERACAVTRELGQRLGLEHAAEAAIERAEATIAAARTRLPAKPPPALVIRFVDARNAYVFGAGGLFDDVMKKMGLSNGWRAPPNYWGFTLASILSLAKADPASRLFIVAPNQQPDAVAMMRSDPLWRAMPFVRRGDVAHLPPVWFFGATEAAARFATMIANAFSESGQSVVPHAG